MAPSERAVVDVLFDQPGELALELGEYGILESLKLPQPPPPLRFPRHPNGFTVQVFWDSDVGKWIEAASYALSHRRDEEIEAKRVVLEAQQANIRTYTSRNIGALPPTAAS